MRVTRFMTFLFLFLSASFFLAPEFRQGLSAPVFAGAFAGGQWNWLMRAGRIPASRVDSLARQAEERHDARLLAFASLHQEDLRRRFQLAERAAGIDASFTWVVWSPGALRNLNAAEVSRAAKRLQTWDPGNAIGFLCEAERIFDARKLGSLWAEPGKRVLQLAGETEWRAVMAKAFAAPRYDAYVQKRFDLERSVLREQKMDRPATMLLSVAATPLPNLLNVRQYARLLTELGIQAESDGRPAEAIANYWQVAHFGGRLQLNGVSPIEKMVARSLQQMAYERLIPALGKQGRADEAMTLQYILEELRIEREIQLGQDPLAQSSNYNWSALLVHIFAGLVIVFGVFTAGTFVYVNIKRRFRREQLGRLYQFLTIAENYAPLLLFLACLGLYVTNFPYAQNFNYYMTAHGKINDLDPFIYNVFPAYFAYPGHTQLGLVNPFRPLAWYAVAAIALAALSAYLTQRRATPNTRSGPAPAAGVAV